MQAEDMGALVDAHSTAVYRFCLRLCRRRQEAEELFQQTFLKAMELCRKIDLDQNPKAFLFSIAARTFQRGYGRQTRRQRIAPTVSMHDSRHQEIAEGAADPMRLEEGIVQDELRLFTLQAIDALPDKLRLPVVLYYGEEMALADIAKTLGIPNGSVKSRLHRARAELRTRLEEKGYEANEVFG
jgi:RNA polymerase sigma-70 factor, ECF subfamily